MNNGLSVRNKSRGTIDVVRIGMMAALVCLATMMIKIPTGMAIGYVHAGDCMVFIAAVLLGKKEGAIAAGLGMGLADFILGYAYYIPFTVVIKMVMAFIAGSIALGGTGNGKNIVRKVIGFTAAGIWMVAGYFGAKIILVKYVLLKTESFNEAIAMATASIPGNIGQFVVGMIIAVPVLLLIENRIKIK